MKLQDLINSIGKKRVWGNTDIDIKLVTDDSRKVKKGSLFVAISGLHFDGYKFIENAIEQGAKTIVSEKNPQKKWLRRVAYIKVSSGRLAFGLMAAKWFNNPSKKLKVIGVTGTKGKTTTSFLIYSILKKAGKKVGVITSNGAFIGKKEIDTGFHVTNPAPLALQKLLNDMVDKKCEYAVIEATSHGLDQERVAGVNFDIGVFTNLSHEHLDYHKTMSAYLNAKSKLFKNTRISILNKSDSSYEKLVKKITNNKKLITYSFGEEESDFRVTDYRETDGFSEIKIEDKGKMNTIYSSLLGNYNSMNIAAAVAVARAYKIKWSDIKKALKNFKGIKGRLEKIENKRGLQIYIDFAHTPNSLESVLSYLKNKTHGKLVAVFGSAGERDTSKRPLMGEIAGRLADVAIITAEDPRSEKPEDIVSQIAEGAIKAKSVEVDPKDFVDLIEGRVFMRIPERGEAILKAIEIGNRGDLIAILGKGHEKSMAYDGVEYPWSDEKAIKLALHGNALEVKRK